MDSKRLRLAGIVLVVCGVALLISGAIGGRTFSWALGGAFLAIGALLFMRARGE
jgi:hypothetical protein